VREQRANGAEKLRVIERASRSASAILRRQPFCDRVRGPVRTLITGQAFDSILRDRQDVALATLASLAERLSSLV
jgi:hypothetical protein